MAWSPEVDSDPIVRGALDPNHRNIIFMESL